MTEPAHIAALLAQSDHRIVVTGPSGWIGRATLDLLHDALGEAFEERVVCFGSRRADVHLSPTRSITQQPLSELARLSHQPTLLLHFAFLTKDRAETMAEADYCAANTAIRQTVLDALGPIGAQGVFLASSGAARYADDARAAPAMRLYGSLKREDEDAFAEWAQTHGTSAAIARIFNISGPYINKVRSYALSSFVLDALAGGPIVVRADHEVRRGYVAIAELISLAFALLLVESGVTRFDTGGDEIELGALAERIAAQMHCAVERPAMRSGAADIYLGDDAAYRRLLDRFGIAPVPMAQQIAETVAFLTNANRQSAPQDSYA